MNLRFSVDGPLEEIVGTAWPDAAEDDLIHDYENVYEWVWLSLPASGIRLNISREHEWGEETRLHPIYVGSFRLDRDEHLDVPLDAVAQRLADARRCPVEVFSGRVNLDAKDASPVRTARPSVAE